MTTTYYADYVGNVLNDDANFTASRSASAGDSVDMGGFPYGPEVSISGQRIIRQFVSFNTSGIPNNAVITAATLKIYLWSSSDGTNDAQGYVTVVQGTPADPTSLVVDDFDQVGSTKGSSNDVDLTTSTTGATPNVFTLNSTGIGWINKTGRTTFALREGHDFENINITSGGNGWRLDNSNYSMELEITFTTTTNSDRSPTQTGAGKNEMTNPSNLFENGSSYVTADPNNLANDEQDYYGFSFPDLLRLSSGDDIAKIEVVVRGKASASGESYIGAYLSWDGGTNYTSVGFTNEFTTSDADYTVFPLTGSPSDLWGRAWSLSEFSPSNFRVRIEAFTSGTATLSVKHVFVRIHHIGAASKVRETISEGMLVPARRV